MATQPSPPPSNGGNHVGLRFGDKALSLQSQALVLVIFIVVVGILAWYRAQTLALALKDLVVGQTHMTAAIHEDTAATKELLQTELHTLREALLTRQLAIQQTSSEERTALSQALMAHSQQSQMYQAQAHQCVEQVMALMQQLRQRGVGP